MNDWSYLEKNCAGNVLEKKGKIFLDVRETRAFQTVCQIGKVFLQVE